MKKEDKAIIIANIADELKNYSCVYLPQTSGLDAEKTSALRRAAFGAEVKMLCVKNTLLKQAFEQSEIDYSGLYDLLNGETSSTHWPPSRARTNLSPTSWHCSSRRQRTLSALSRAELQSFTAFWKPYPTKNKFQYKKIKKEIRQWQI